MKSQKATITTVLTFILVAYAANTFDIGGQLAPWHYDVSGRTFTEWHKVADFYLGKRMPVVGLSFLFFQIVFLILDWKNRRLRPFRYMALALLTQILVIIISINTNVALNPVMNVWNPDQLPANWQAIRDEWLGGHERNFYFNTTIAILTFLGCYFYWTKPQIHAND